METVINLLTCTVLLMSFIVLCNIIYEMIKEKLSKKKDNTKIIATIPKYDRNKNFCPFSHVGEEFPCENCRCSIEFKSADGKESQGYRCGLINWY